jgi:hypothetical protein
VDVYGCTWSYTAYEKAILLKVKDISLSVEVCGAENGVPERVRTSNLLLRREPRYPIVPRGRYIF